MEYLKSKQHQEMMKHCVKYYRIEDGIRYVPKCVFVGIEECRDKNENCSECWNEYVEFGFGISKIIEIKLFEPKPQLLKAILNVCDYLGFEMEEKDND